MPKQPHYVISVSEKKVVTFFFGDYNRSNYNEISRAIDEDPKLSRNNMLSFKALIIHAFNIRMTSEAVGLFIHLYKRYKEACPKKDIFIYIGGNSGVRQVLQVTKVINLFVEIPPACLSKNEQLAYVDSCLARSS